MKFAVIQPSIYTKPSPIQDSKSLFLTLSVSETADHRLPPLQLMSYSNTSGSRKIFSVWITSTRGEQLVKRVSSFVSVTLLLSSASHERLISPSFDLQDDLLVPCFVYCPCFLPFAFIFLRPSLRTSVAIPCSFLPFLPSVSPSSLAALPPASASFSLLVFESAQLVTFCPFGFVVIHDIPLTSNALPNMREKGKANRCEWYFQQSESK